jgi:hypothetical protein
MCPVKYKKAIEIMQEISGGQAFSVDKGRLFHRSGEVVDRCSVWLNGAGMFTATTFEECIRQLSEKLCSCPECESPVVSGVCQSAACKGGLL